MTDRMTPAPTISDFERAIKAATKVIRAAWPLLLVATSSGGGVGGASTDPVTALDKRISLAAEITRDLARWADAIRVGRPVTKALPRSSDTTGLLDFIDRHAEWLSGQAEARRCVEELTDRARELRALATPRRREFVHLGICTIEHWDGESETILPCGGRVRARIGAADGMAMCERCSTWHAIAWWQWELGLTKPPLSAEAMARVLRERMGVHVTGRTVRNWLKAGLIDAYAEPFGPAPQWPRFDQEVVMLQVAQMGRACAMCGQPWHGSGDLCTRCYVTASSRSQRPARATAKASTPVRGARPAYRPVNARVPLVDKDGKPVDLAWCDRGDMPAAWCACGIDHETG